MKNNLFIFILNSILLAQLQGFTNNRVDTCSTNKDTEETGEYKIELSSANRLLYGDFSLCQNCHLQKK